MPETAAAFMPIAFIAAATRSAWLYAGGVDDPRRVTEAALVEIGGRHVERIEVERGGQLSLVEVATDDLDGAQ